MAMEELKKVQENVSQIIEKVANEPSVLLSDAQKRVHKDVHNLHDLHATVVDMTKKVVISHENMEDAIAGVKTMERIGLPTIEHMMDKLNSSISLMNEHSAKQNQSNIVLATLGSAIKRASIAGWRSSQAKDPNSDGKQDTEGNVTDPNSDGKLDTEGNVTEICSSDHSDQNGCHKQDTESKVTEICSSDHSDQNGCHKQDTEGKVTEICSSDHSDQNGCHKQDTGINVTEICSSDQNGCHKQDTGINVTEICSSDHSAQNGCHKQDTGINVTEICSSDHSDQNGCCGRERLSSVTNTINGSSNWSVHTRFKSALQRVVGSLVRCSCHSNIINENHDSMSNMSSCKDVEGCNLQPMQIHEEASIAIASSKSRDQDLEPSSENILQFQEEPASNLEE